MGNPLLDCLKMLKNEAPKDMENADTDTLKNFLGSVQEYTQKLQQNIAENAPEDKKEKYMKGAQAINDMINNGLENPGSEVDTSGVDKFIDEAKNITNKKHLSKQEKAAAEVLNQFDKQDGKE